MTPMEALQDTLAGEHAAVYLYGVIGARVSLPSAPELAEQVRKVYALHRDRRDQLTAMVLTAGGDPVPSEVSYALPGAASTLPQLTAAALDVERRCTEVYAQMVGSTAGANRQWAIEAMSDAAVRQLGFGGNPQAFPGLPEL